MTTIHASIYVDSQDSTDEGWAWRVVAIDEVGARHEESGGCVDEADGIQQVRAYAPEAPADLYITASERWDYCDADQGSYTWSGERA